MTDLLLPGTAVDGLGDRLRAGTRPTPYLDLDVPHAVATYRRLAAALPGTALHYAVKANPDPTLLAALAAAGCRFDVASPAEITAAQYWRARRPTELVYSNPVKRREDVRFAVRSGVDLFVVDSPGEVAKVAEEAPGSGGAVPPRHLWRRVGLAAVTQVRLLDRRGRRPPPRGGPARGLRVAGVSFHVGSQQRDPRGMAAADRGRRAGLRGPAG